MSRNFQFSIDRGGTFTDIYCHVNLTNDDVNDKNGNDDEMKQITQKQIVLKLLSEDPSNYKDAPTEGIRRILEQVTGIPHPRNTPVDTSRIEYIRMGTTVATNALLERKGERVALITTAGFCDLQIIGNQSRPKIFDLNIKRPDVLYELVEEISERVVLLKDGEYVAEDQSRVHLGISQELVYVEKEINENEVREKLLKILGHGITSIAVSFLHSYTFSKHEKVVQRIAQELGFTQISLSSDIMPMIRFVPRTCTTCVDAYLTPVIKRYLDSFCVGFDSNLSKVKISFMQSDGGLTPMSSFLGTHAILSGPAGGVVGYALTSQVKDENNNTNSQSDSLMPVIGFDMGGTSTDVSRYAGTFEHVFETTTAGVTIQSPQLDINTVAAGGGSRLFFRNKIFVVGPESAGAHPGPVCYRKGGYLAVTDANLLLGRIQPALFPSIFGETEDQPLDLNGTTLAFEALTKQINLEMPDQNYSIDEIAYGFLRVANEAMARPIRNLTTMKGYDVTKHVLSCFGGAGPQHCCAIAKSLGMRKIVVHKHSGILSAYGLSLSDIVEERQEPCSGRQLSPESFSILKQRLTVLLEAAVTTLQQQGFTNDLISHTCFLNCRYTGTDTAIMTPISLDPSRVTEVELIEDISTCIASFISSYKREYGFELIDRKILVDDLRVRAVGHNIDSVALRSPSTGAMVQRTNSLPLPQPHSSSLVYFEGGRLNTPVYLLKQFTTGLFSDGDYYEVIGPAIIIQDVATVIVETDCIAHVSPVGNIEITVQSSGVRSISSTVMDPIYLSIFSHRFMGIAEQMGRTLQRTSISVNIKERLDFSCALFDCHGGLVANAPHLPVHLGAMSEAVKYQLKHWKNVNEKGILPPPPAGKAFQDGIVDGDVLLSNHPQLAGGSHLPDITVITPIFSGGKIVFFVASRGHHADIGGIAPGSMPPLSKTLIEEGAAIVAFKLVDNGIFQEEGISELLQAPGKLKDNFGTRNLSDNISDLRAQVAANNRGRALIEELVVEYGLSVVQAYMTFIQDTAERAVRNMLKTFYVSRNLHEQGGFVSAEDFLDDGTPIRLKVSINYDDGSAIFDFNGTGPEMYGNLNAPPAVTFSAVIYCLRCLLPDIMDIPLNQGCLQPITISLPPQSLLHPSSTAAVVGGNVLTSQRVTDVILRAFEACAASQGCMNNLTFGDGTMGYYETIAGGSGAGPSYNGVSGVHTHMTNTRITDPEILERRYPVILRRFGLREGSGGLGQYRGGDGVIRELEFMKPLIVSILSERRSFQPYGLHGGHCGARGINLITFSSRTQEDGSITDSKIVSLGGKNTISVLKNDRLTILTPGGGGYGEPSKSQDIQLESENKKDEVMMTSGSLHSYQLSQESA